MDQARSEQFGDAGRIRILRETVSFLEMELCPRMVSLHPDIVSEAFVKVKPFGQSDKQSDDLPRVR
jgi:hypothetical protein